MFSDNRIANSALRGALLGVGAAALLTGCVAEPSAVEADFGSSVRAMIEAQTVRSDTPTPTLEGKKSQKVLRVYRENVSAPEEVSQDVIIRVGGN